MTVHYLVYYYFIRTRYILTMILFTRYRTSHFMIRSCKDHKTYYLVWFIATYFM